MDQPRQGIALLLAITILAILIGGIDAGTVSVTASPLSINSIATYTWTIGLASTPYSPLTISFPSQVTIFANTTLTVNGVSTNYSRSSNSLTISSAISTASLTIIVSNVQNPSSAIASSSFSYTTNNDSGTVGNFDRVQYTSGVFRSCNWAFSLCTEQSASDLLITFTTINPIPSGSAYFLVGYATIWTNSLTKGLTSGVSSVTCAYSTNGSAYNTGTCVIAANEIDLSFSTTSGISSGTSITVKISGVNSPPTKTTSTSASYYTYTADGSQNKIDGFTSCTIANTCVTNQTSATFSNTTMLVNANYGSPQLLFPNSMAVTIQSSDTIDVYYSPFSSLLTCTLLLFYRSGTSTYSLGSPVVSTNYITFTYTSSTNTDYSSPTNIRLTCSGFLLPPSETPTTLAFIWKRSANDYMHLNTSIAATATTFNSSKASLALSSTSMVSPSTYTFSFLTGQPLGGNPAFAITFSSDFTINTPICTITISGLTVSSSSCSYSSSNFQLSINITTAAATIAAGSNFTFLVSGITNPASPSSFSFPMSTYYDSSVSTSKVQTSLTAFTATITEITNYPVTLTPTGLTVYSAANIVLTFTTTIAIPTQSTFYIEFPSGVSNINPNSNLIQVGGGAIPLGNGLTTSNVTNSVTFQSGIEISKNSTVSITIPLTTPANIGTYSYVKLTISKNSTNYISSLSSLFLNVNSVNTMTVTITPQNSFAGAISTYILTLFLTIPHNTTFIVQVDVPSDTKFNSANSSCTNCLTNLTTSGTSSFFFTANNPSGFSSSSISFTLGSFTNIGYVGTGLAWGISTKTTSPVNLISFSTAYVSIAYTNTLTGILSRNESYYKNNTSPVKMTFTFTNKLSTGDYILLSMTSDVYSPVNTSSVTCSSIYGACAQVGNSSNVTVVKITPDVSSIINNTYFVIVEGLISGSSSSYGFTYNINIRTQTSLGYPMDAGIMIYNVSCGQISGSSCRQCFNNSCINCYVDIGQYLQGGACVGACGPATSYLSYANNSTGQCTACINNCRTCENSTYCTSCITNYYLYTTDNTCQMTCSTTTGFYKTTGTNTSNLICGTCVSNCLECVNGSNTCTRCDNTTVLISGICQGACGSTNYYPLNGQCLPCDSSCFSCTGAGAGSCITCSANYHRYLTLCVSSCPTGTAVNPSNGNCGCDTPCLTCSTYTSCTVCLNSSQWVLNGGCIGSCPVGTYANSGQCNSCSSGCLNCTINTCTVCVNGSYLFNNSCYSDCNLISEQYDNFGTTCILCQTGCDRCSTGNCTSCLSDYTMSAGLCIKTCLLSNSCSLNEQVMPLPGSLSLVVWAGIAIIIHFIQKKNYLPYSIILLSGIIQLVLILGLLSTVNSSSSARLLATSTAYIGQMKALLIVAICLNYIQNICYLIVFMRYIKPLITNARQIDMISNFVVIFIATFTNFRFGLLAFSRMFPKPNIYVQNASKLTPIHYLCLFSIFMDVVALTASGIGLTNAQKLSNTFMLSIDLLMVIVVNIVLTIWFVAGSKPDQYYEDIKKYQIQDNTHNNTDENLPNEKNLSKAHMIANESFNFDDLDHTELDDGSFKKLTRNPNKDGNHDDDINRENPQPVTISSKINDLSDPDPFMDPNFQNNIKSKRASKETKANVSKLNKVTIKKSLDQQGKSVDDNITPKKGNTVTSQFTKNAIKSDRKRIEEQKDIIEVSQSQYPDLDQKSNKDPNNIFNSKPRLNKPKKLNPRALTKSIEQPMKLMKKGDKKIGYFQSDAYQSNADGEDLQEIIKQKIWQSTIKLQRPSLETYKESNQQTGHEEISPSMFNLQNQRLDITDIQSDPQD